ncbi:hypothetical protein [Ideonella sp.]|uniref:sialidase family protein n=1 Tax=Ideonella sp. TaxID=1929293 RepID=UPI003BB6E0E9
MISRRHFIQQAGLCTLAAGPLASASAATPAPGPYQWASVPFGAGGFVDGFVFHPRQAGLLYARTDIGGAYRFDVAGQRWLPLLDHLTKADSDLGGVLSLAVDPADPQRVYLACGMYTGEWARGAALLSSSNQGASWTVTELGIKLGGNEPGRGTGERLQVDPFHGDILFLGTTRDGLMQSRDRGRSFRAVSFPAKHVSLVAIDPTVGQAGQGARRIYAGSHDQAGLYVSNDGGASFARESATPAQVPQRAAFGPDGTLYVSFALGDPGQAPNPGNAKTGSLWMRDRAGRWTDISPVKAPGALGFGYSGLDADPRTPGRLLVSTIERWGPGDEVFLSTDHGAHWTALGPRSRHDARAWPWLANYTQGQDKMGHWIADLKIDPHQSDRVIYGTGYGLWLTRNVGAALQPGGTVDWDFAVANLEETAALELKSPSGGATLLAAMGDVSGGAWDDLGKGPSAGLFAPSNETNRSVDFAYLNPGVIARTSDMAATGGYLSTDGGVSWRPFGPSARAAKTPEGWTAPTGTVAVSAQGGFLVWAPEKQPALCSRNRGRSWELCAGWPADRSVALTPVADRHVEGVFHVHDRAGGQVLTSVDGGLSFKPTVTGLRKVENWQSAQLLCAPGGLRDLWLALPDTLLRLAGADLPPKVIKPVVDPWLMALGKAAPGAAYHSVFVWGKVWAGGVLAEGLFRSDDAGNSFKRIDDDTHRYGRLLSLAADPLEHGTVYLAPHGRGVIVGRPSKAA